MQIHNLVDWKTHLETLKAWKTAGKIRYIGITHYTAERGGRRKRFFALTNAGVRALNDIQEVRSRLWQAIPPGKFQLIGG